MTAASALARPPEGTVERWAWDYVSVRDLGTKCSPPSPPAQWEVSAPARRVETPGRPGELEVVPRSPRSPRRGALRDPSRRAQLLHTFWHHELQAAELMCWALLAFPEAERSFRRGLVAIWRDEVRHMGMYAAQLESLGFAIGDFPVRDWFWMRVPQCETPLAFVALVGLGLEAGNLDHAERFAEWFEAAGDPVGAEVQRVVGREEERHVRFAARWFARWTGDLDFDRWRRTLIEPLTPSMLRGRTLNLAARRRSGMTASFLAALDAWDDGGPV